MFTVRYVLNFYVIFIINFRGFSQMKDVKRKGDWITEHHGPRSEAS